MVTPASTPRVAPATCWYQVSASCCLFSSRSTRRSVSRQSERSSRVSLAPASGQRVPVCTVVGGGRDTHDGHENSPILVFFSNLLVGLLPAGGSLLSWADLSQQPRLARIFRKIGRDDGRCSLDSVSHADPGVGRLDQSTPSPARRQPPRSPPSSGALPGPHYPNQSGNPHQKEIRDQSIEQDPRRAEQPPYEAPGDRYGGGQDRRAQQ